MALYAVAFNVLVVVVKFVLAPYGLYEVNEEVALDSLIPLGDSLGAVIAAAVVFAFYSLAYVLVYGLAVRRSGFGGRLAGGVRGAVTPARLAIVAAAVVLLVFTGLGGALLLVVLLSVDTGLEYIDFVFASSVSVLVAVLLAGAHRPRRAWPSGPRPLLPAVVADAALLASFFWLGLAFLALYHALWVVYVLVLTAIWPLRVVVPK